MMDGYELFFVEECERKWIMIYFKVISWHLLEETQENYSAPAYF
jgi:hypothetical protein